MVSEMSNLRIYEKGSDWGQSIEQVVTHNILSPKLDYHQQQQDGIEQRITRSVDAIGSILEKLCDKGILTPQEALEISGMDSYSIDSLTIKEEEE